MKRWLPIVFLGLSLLANITAYIHYVNFLKSWIPHATIESTQPLGLFTFFSLPLALAYLWRCWGPDGKSIMVDRNKVRYGNVLLVLSVCAWVLFRISSIASAWVSETSTSDPLAWLWLSFWRSLAADFSLALGGPLALWLKGIRIPPRE